MQGLMSDLPEWIKWTLALLTSGGASGFGVHKWWQTKIQADGQKFNQESTYREELRGDLDKIKQRQREYEKELVETREKYFEMQEKYHELKLNYESALKENEQFRGEIRKLRDEIRKLREKLEN